MIIGFIGFGKVACNLVRLINADDIKFITSSKNRSPETVENITKSDVEVLDTFKEIAFKSDILISAASPKSALNIAEKYGKYANGIYLDLNNISPTTTLEIAKHVGNLVDGAVIGKIDSQNPILYLSGEKSSELEFLNDYIHIKVISDNIGDASRLKMLRSSYTKTLSAVLIESMQIAKNSNLEDELFEMLEMSEGNGFKEKSLSRINNTLKSSKRKVEELDEIIEYFTDDDLTMVEAARRKLSR